MKNHRNLLFLLLLAACSSDPKPQSADIVTVQPDTPVQENKADSGTVTETANEFIPQQNADTALAKFLYKNYNNFNPHSQFIQYMQWDLQHEQIKPLLVKLYLKGGNKDKILNVLEQNRQAFHDIAVTSALDNYRNGNGIMSMSFAYLVMKNDEAVLPLVQDVLNTPKASAQEREYALKVLKNWKGGGIYR